MIRKLRVVYVDSLQTKTLDLTLSQRPWLPRTKQPGSHRVASSGLPESWVQRRDEMLDLRLVFWEEDEWRLVHDWICWAQAHASTSFKIYLDRELAPNTYRDCYLESPVADTEFGPERASTVGVMEMTVRVRAVSGDLFDEPYIPGLAGHYTPGSIGKFVHGAGWAFPASPELQLVCVSPTSITVRASAFSSSRPGAQHVATAFELRLMDVSEEPDGPPFDASLEWRDATVRTGWIPAADGLKRTFSDLTPGRRYMIHASLADDSGRASRWTSPWVATTAQAYTPEVPILASPEAIQEVSSYAVAPYSHPIAGSEHAYTVWQIAAGSDPFFDAPLFDSGPDAVNLTSFSTDAVSRIQDLLVRAQFISACGEESGWSGTVYYPATVNLAPHPPVAALAEQGVAPAGNGIQLPTASFGISGFSDPNPADQSGQLYSQVSKNASFDDLERDGPWGSVYTSTGIGEAKTLFLWGQTYYYRAKTRDESGLESGWSNVVSFTTQRLPGTPTIANSGLTSSQVTLTGNAFSSADVGATHEATLWQVSTSSSFFSTLPGTGTWDAVNLLSRTVTGLTAGVQYWARARYRDNRGIYSAYSPAISFTPAESSPPAPPSAPTISMVALTPTSFQITLTGFSDPNAGDTHQATYWQFDRFPDFPFGDEPEDNPTGWSPPVGFGPDKMGYVVGHSYPGQTHYAKAKVMDSTGLVSEWSAIVSATYTP
jgi:hypothetical protein